MNGLGQRLAVSAGIGAAVFVGCVSAAPASASPPPGQVDLVGLDFQVINRAGGRCLAAAGNAGPVQRDCAREAAFRWRFVPVSFTGLFLIKNVGSGRCLTIAGGGPADQDRAAEAACDRTAAHHWQLRPPPGVPKGAPHSDAQLVNAHSEKCLTLAGPAEGAPAIQRPCAPVRAQRWTVRVVSIPFLGNAG